jgi:hypothetical protein
MSGTTCNLHPRSDFQAHQPAVRVEVKGRKVPTVTTQNDQFPRLGVYLVRENENPDGDANVGPPRYLDDTVIASR